jgi:FMN phosphatase YigB (HAD superfamily)
MTLTLLLDLDDTLLNTNIDSFIPAYFQALAKELAPHIAPEIMLRALMSGTKRMMENEDFSQTLEQVFNAEFYPQVNSPHEEITAAIEKFYDQIFPTLGGVTTPKPDAKPFIDWAFSQGYRIAIATDPLFPHKATHHRLRWAGFEPEQFEIVSSFENFHFTKTHPAYYAEILGRMGYPDGSVLMVGNDMERDIRPAQRLGLATYHVDDAPAAPSGPEAGGRGKLANLRPWLESTDPASLTPSFKSVDSVLGILSATPAVMNGFSRGLDRSAWSHKPAADEWCLKEVVSHLRDTEREVHQMQIELFKEQDEPFIPRPDTSVWANQRDYIHEDCAVALKEFNEERRKTLKLIKEITVEPSTWERKARHAIFGPTNFLEVVGFIAEHDRLHIQQAWNTLKKM